MYPLFTTASGHSQGGTNCSCTSLMSTNDHISSEEAIASLIRASIWNSTFLERISNHFAQTVSTNGTIKCRNSCYMRHSPPLQHICKQWCKPRQSRVIKIQDVCVDICPLKRWKRQVLGKKCINVYATEAPHRCNILVNDVARGSDGWLRHHVW